VKKSIPPLKTKKKSGTKGKAQTSRKSSAARNVLTKPASASGNVAPQKPNRPVTAVIADEKDIARGIRTLRRKCEHMQKAHERAGHPPVRRNEAGFIGLCRIIVAQQISASAARGIWARVEAGVKPLTPARLAAMSEDELRACGLSRPKIRTLRAISEAVLGGLDLDALAVIDEEEARASLTAISGVGPWTADIYLMFCLGRADVFAPGDLALQIATQMLMDLKERPSKDEMAKIAERWSPWRGVAARLLWHYYAAEKAQKSALPT